MRTGSISLHVAIRLLLIDLALNLAVPVTFFTLQHIEQPSRLFPLYALIIPLRMAASLGYLLHLLDPIARWDAEAPAAQRGELLARAARAAQIAPRRYTLLQIFFWSTEHVGITLYLLHVDPTRCPLGPRTLETVALGALGLALGSGTLYYPLLTILLGSQAERIVRAAGERGLPLARGRSSLRAKITLLALALAGAPTLALTSFGYSAEIDASAARAERQAERRTVAVERRLAARVAAGGEPGEGELRALVSPTADDEARAFITDAAGRVLAGDEVLAAVPALDAWLRAIPPEQGEGTRSDVVQAQALSFARVGDRYLVGAVARAPSSAPIGLALTYASTLFVVLLWAPLCAFAVARLLSSPIRQITDAARRMVEEGALTRVEPIAVAQGDEVGELGDQFNALLALLQALSRSASEVAEGSLEVQIQGKGELPDAFRSMVASLRAMVREIRGTSAKLALAAAGIHGASQEQEEAATSQSAATIEISRTMDSLSSAAVHVTDTAQGVLRDAERTLQTTDAMVARIGELTGLVSRIGELQELIGDIADRSDLLALNGSLEASHAGAAGRGFALVAAEMRRLAERVSSSTHTARELVRSIRSAGGSTMSATKESRALAESTTEAARLITLVAQQQRTGTEQVSQSIRDIAQVLSSSAAATTQTRAAAEELKRQADHLAELGERFRVDARA
jgi:methyl-accepting chemotaxis protein